MVGGTVRVSFCSVVRASILHVDETVWKLGKKSCYTWVFGTIADVYYRCGVGRGKEVLTEVLGEKYAGAGVTDDCRDRSTQTGRKLWDKLKDLSAGVFATDHWKSYEDFIPPEQHRQRAP